MNVSAGRERARAAASAPPAQLVVPPMRGPAARGARARAPRSLPAPLALPAPPAPPALAGQRLLRQRAAAPARARAAPARAHPPLALPPDVLVAPVVFTFTW